MATDYKWTVRKGNTSRLAVLYEELDGTVILTTGCVGTLHIYDGGDEILTVVAANDAPSGRFDILLTRLQILNLDFRQAEFEFNVVFPNGDETTLIDGPFVVESGRGPFE